MALDINGDNYKRNVAAFKALNESKLAQARDRNTALIDQKVEKRVKENFAKIQARQAQINGINQVGQAMPSRGIANRVAEVQQGLTAPYVSPVIPEMFKTRPLTQQQQQNLAQYQQQSQQVEQPFDPYKPATIVSLTELAGYDPVTLSPLTPETIKPGMAVKQQMSPREIFLGGREEGDKTLVNSAIQMVFTKAYEAYVNRDGKTVQTPEQAIEVAREETIAAGATAKEAHDAETFLLQNGDIFAAAPGSEAAKLYDAVANGNFSIANGAIKVEPTKEQQVQEARVVQEAKLNSANVSQQEKEETLLMYNLQDKLNAMDQAMMDGKYVSAASYEYAYNRFIHLTEKLGYGLILPPIEQVLPQTNAAPATGEIKPTGTVDSKQITEIVQYALNNGYQFDMQDGQVDIDLGEVYRGAAAGDEVYSLLYQTIRPMYSNLTDDEFANFASTQ